MRIIILGAGQVGKTVAEIMATEENDITVVDRHVGVLRELQHRLDIRTVVGHAPHPQVLSRAGIEDADLIFAVTNDDEVNMIACQVAYSLFQTPTRLARVRSADYLEHPELFAPAAMPVTYLINPELMVTTNIQRLIENPGTFEGADFADGQVQLAAMRVERGSPMDGQPVRMLGKFLGPARAGLTALYRNGRSVLPGPDQPIAQGDEAYIFTAQRDMQRVVKAFHPGGKPNRRVVIAGGGNLGLRLARQIELGRNVKIIERDSERCRFLASALRSSVVLCGDVTDSELLQSEGIDSADVYCATTHEDKTNIVSAMLAKRMGAHKTLAIINSFSHGMLAQQAALDIALTPSEVTIGALLTYIRRGDVVKVASLRQGQAEAIEVVARGDASTSHAVGRTIAELPLSDGARVGAIMRQERLLFPNGETVIESNDRVMLFCDDKEQVPQVERLFQVSITFM